MESTWKLLIGIAVFIVFVFVGIDNVVRPNISNLRKGGEELTQWNRLQVRIAAVVFTGFASFGLYELLRDLLWRWKSVNRTRNSDGSRPFVWSHFSVDGLDSGFTRLSLELRL
jgi:hypothetical protein